MRSGALAPMLVGLVAVAALLLAPAVLANSVQSLPSGCAPLFTGPDVEEQLCYDANDPGCPLYTLARYKDETGWHKHCIGQ